MNNEIEHYQKLLFDAVTAEYPFHTEYGIGSDIDLVTADFGKLQDRLIPMKKCTDTSKDNSSEINFVISQNERFALAFIGRLEAFFKSKEDVIMFKLKYG